LLELTAVSFGYPGTAAKAVDAVSLRVAAGEFVAIAGRNGSGKTTLTRLVMGLLRPAEGTVRFAGQDTKKLSPADMARHIGYVFQNPDRQIFRDTVAAEVAYGPEQLGFTPAERDAAVREALQAVGLDGVAGAYPRALPRGMRQKVAIASALALRPAMLILDEPTSGQDAAERERLLGLLLALNRGGKTVILVTHDMGLLAKCARRVVVMDSGRIAYDGAVEDLFSTGRDIGAWGLREPPVLTVARGLAPWGVRAAWDPDDVARQISELTGRGKRNG